MNFLKVERATTHRYGIKLLPLFILFFLGLGTVQAPLINPSIDSGWYKNLIQPLGKPPNWAFPVAWTMIYTLIGVGFWQFFRCCRRGFLDPILWFAGLLPVLNIAWNWVFFVQHWLWIGAVLLPVIVLHGGILALYFSKVSKGAAFAMAPYVAWTAYASYLTIGIAILN
jgi:tryptophan-rich sensory protein